MRALHFGFPPFNSMSAMTLGQDKALPIVVHIAPRKERVVGEKSPLHLLTVLSEIA
jgi:hypothetical protein